jgi:DNA-binding beta-propeller fold protein YncE
MTLTLRAHIDLPPHADGGFDHADVHLASGHVWVAHTANGTLDEFDPERQVVIRTLAECAEASGVLCVQPEAGGPWVFGAARGSGVLLVVEPVSGEVVRRVAVGPRPNGLAWDSQRGHLLVADVEDHTARLLDPGTGRQVACAELAGRPRWCVYDAPRDRFLVNVQRPACVALVDAATGAVAGAIPVSAVGPHGLDQDLVRGRAFVACDEGVVVVLDIAAEREVGRVPIAGAPDVTWSNAARDRLYVAIGQPGVVDVIDCATLRLVERVPTEPDAHTTAFDAQRQRLYVFLPRRGAAAVYAEVD